MTMNASSRTYSIGEVSKLMGISAYTLRYYEKIGLLVFVNRDENGQRRFTTSDILTLNTIYRLKDTGMALKDIRQYIKLVNEGKSSISQRRQLMEKQKAIVEKRIKDLQDDLVTINAKLKYYQEAEKQNSLAVCHDERDALLQRILHMQG